MKIKDLKVKYQQAKEEADEQNKKCILIKSYIEDLIESKIAFENVLNILNNELITLNKQIEKEREAFKGDAKGKANFKNYAKSLFIKQKKISIFKVFNLKIF